MRTRFVGVILLTGWMCAQEVAPEVRRAEEELQRVQALVDAGAAPRVSLAKAQDSLEAARDLAVLRSTLYGRIEVEELTEQQSEAMLGAAQRNWLRQQKKLEEATRLVEEGVLARVELARYVAEVERSREIHDLAVGRSRLLLQLASIVRAEQEAAAELEESPEGPLGPQPMVERYEGDGVFHNGHLKLAVLAFEKEFGKSLPISARGDTALHRALGFDHRGRVDVALSPDSKEGVWLRDWLESMRVPYYAIRGFVAGRATAAHVHIGPPSLRLRRTD